MYKFLIQALANPTIEDMFVAWYVAGSCSVAVSIPFRLFHSNSILILFWFILAQSSLVQSSLLYSILFYSTLFYSNFSFHFTLFYPILLCSLLFYPILFLF